MGVPPGTLTQRFRWDVLSFYGDHFGWAELEEFGRTDRMTIAIGGGDYLNLREVEGAAELRGYEHFGLRLPTAEAVECVWGAVADDRRAADLEPMQRGPDGFRQFRLRFLLPLMVEVQHVPAGRMDPPGG